MTRSPTSGMTRCVEFRHHSNSSQSRVLNNRGDVVLTVYHRFMISAFRQFRILLALVRKTVIVDNVPMENIQLVVRHSIEDHLEHVFLDEVSTRIDQQTAMREPRLV